MGAPPAPNWRESVMTAIDGEPERRDARRQASLSTSSRTEAAERSKAACSSGVSSICDDLLGPAPTELDRDADEEAIGAVLALEQDGAGQDGLRVAQDGVDHLGHGGGRGVVGRAGLEQRHDLGAAVARAVDERLDALGAAGGR